MPKIPFKTGRSDCIPKSEDEPYIAKDTEVHPSANFNGPDLLDWFAKYFNFKKEDGEPDAEAIVALMGAHTIGKFDPTNSMFKYFWSREEKIILNIIFRD